MSNNDHDSAKYGNHCRGGSDSYWILVKPRLSRHAGVQNDDLCSATRMCVVNISQLWTKKSNETSVIASFTSSHKNSPREFIMQLSSEKQQDQQWKNQCLHQRQNSSPLHTSNFSDLLTWGLGCLVVGGKKTFLKLTHVQSAATHLVVISTARDVGLIQHAVEILHDLGEAVRCAFVDLVGGTLLWGALFQTVG